MTRTDRINFLLFKSKRWKINKQLRGKSFNFAHRCRVYASCCKFIPLKPRNKRSLESNCKMWAMEVFTFKWVWHCFTQEGSLLIAVPRVSNTWLRRLQTKEQICNFKWNFCLHFNMKLRLLCYFIIYLTFFTTQMTV